MRQNSLQSTPIVLSKNLANIRIDFAPLLNDEFLSSMTIIWLIHDMRPFSVYATNFQWNPDHESEMTVPELLFHCGTDILTICEVCLG